jgi:hypothetical protein
MKKVTLIITSGTLATVLLLAAAGQSSQPGYGETANTALVSHFKTTVTDAGGEPTVQHVSLTDSTEITDQNKETMVDLFNQATPGQAFVALIGKDAQQDILDYLSDNVTNLDQITIVAVSSDYMFGAPSDNNCSDAQANVDAAIDAAIQNSPGLYSCTTAGQVLEYQTVS